MDPPTCEKHITHMFFVTLIPFIKHPVYKIVPISAATLLLGGVFCPLYYPTYYQYQPEINSIDLALMFIVYCYMLFMYISWDKNSCFEHTSVSRLNEITTLGFYGLFMMYWLYETIVQHTYHQENNALIQIGNIYMSLAWYVYFSTCSLLYYYVCIKLAQRTQSIGDWLKTLKRERPNIEEFYKTYKQHHKAIKVFGRNWNFLIIIGFITLTYHIPIDIINVLVNRKYTDIAGIVVKSLGLAWYTYKICSLNDMEPKVISYLYKHTLYNAEEMHTIEKYASYHELGLNFYGIKINGSLIIKLGLLTINFIIPTIYGLVSNKLVLHNLS